MMSLPPLLRKKCLTRLDELITEAESLFEVIEPKSGDIPTSSAWHDSSFCRRAAEWRAKCASLLFQILPADHIYRKAIEVFAGFDSDDGFPEVIGTLSAIRDDLAQSFLDNLGTQIQAEVAEDYMGQAEGLLHEGIPGQCDHVPAAVLAGAVLEKAMRTLCGKQQPPVPTVNANDEPKKMNLLIDDLKKAGVFNETKAKQLRAWTGIRNHAAHGEFDQFTRSDVEQMLTGIKHFLGEYLK